MDRWVRSVVAVFVVLALLGLIAFARGEPRHGEDFTASGGRDRRRTGV